MWFYKHSVTGSFAAAILQSFIKFRPGFECCCCSVFSKPSKLPNQMERILHLVEKLVEQIGSGENTSQLLHTVQQLQQELISRQHSQNPPVSSKVAVVMPGSNAYQRIDRLPDREQKAVPVIPEEDRRFIPKDSPVVDIYKQDKQPEAPEIKKEEPVKKEEPLPAHIISSTDAVVAPKYNVGPNPKEVFSGGYNNVRETPAQMHYVAREKEVHEAIAEKRESLNDMLKQEKHELGSMLKEAPIKDLRKGIGVNDKFLFISELFRGDEDMYERSIKTINGFHILPEAEYWINRELKVKLGWNDGKDTVQHFYGIVRRRFS
jgi:hypothetical protein